MLKTEDLNNEVPWFEDSVCVKSADWKNAFMCSCSPWVIKRQHKHVNQNFERRFPLLFINNQQTQTILKLILDETRIKQTLAYYILELSTLVHYTDDS